MEDATNAPPASSCMPELPLAGRSLRDLRTPSQPGGAGRSSPFLPRDFEEGRGLKPRESGKRTRRAQRGDGPRRRMVEAARAIASIAFLLGDRSYDLAPDDTLGCKAAIPRRWRDDDSLRPANRSLPGGARLFRSRRYPRKPPSGQVRGESMRVRIRAAGSPGTKRARKRVIVGRGHPLRGSR